MPCSSLTPHDILYLIKGLQAGMRDGSVTVYSGRKLVKILKEALNRPA